MARNAPPSPANAPDDDDRVVLVLVDVDAERLGRDRVLAAGPQPQAERRAPQDEVGRRRSAATAMHRQEREAGRQTARRTAATSETKNQSLVLDVAQQVRGARHGRAPAGRSIGGDCVVPPPGLPMKSDRGEVLRDPERQDVDRHAGDDVVDAEGHRRQRVQQTAERTADDADEHARPTDPTGSRPKPAPHVPRIIIPSRPMFTTPARSDHRPPSPAMRDRHGQRDGSANGAAGRRCRRRR